MPASSPTNRRTTSALLAAATASLMLAGFPLFSMPFTPVADGGAGAATPAASPASNGGMSTPLAYRTCSFPSLATIPSRGVTASLAWPLPAQGPSCDALSSAKGPITATVLLLLNGRISALFCRRTSDSCASLRATSRFSGVKISVFSRFGSE